MVDSASANIKLVKFIVQHFNTLNIAYVQKLIRTGFIKVNTKKVKIDYITALNDTVYINLNVVNNFNATKPVKKTVDISIYKHIIKEIKNNIIYQDNDIVAINKPAGLAVQGGSGVVFSLANALNNHIVADTNLHIVHRLDKETSGVLLLAKNKDVANYLFNLFKNKEINKTYNAIITYNNITANSGVINANLLKTTINNQQNANHAQYENTKENTKEQVIVDEQGKPSVTHYTILKKNSNFALIEYKPLTGRTHQLRVHTNYAFNGSIIGDYKYGFSKNYISNALKQVDIKRMYLHAYNIKFINPQGKLIDITASLPHYFNNAVASIFN